MLIKLHAALEADKNIKIEKRCRGKDVSRLGAFAYGEKVTFSATVPRKLGVSAVVLRIAPDGGAQTDIPLEFFETREGSDRYVTVLDTEKQCEGESDRLFFYEFLFLRGFDTLFSDTQNNVDFTLSSQSANRFCLMVYQRDYQTPDWFRGGVMYHVFPDRFCRGAGEVALRKGAVLDEDWENGIPQYAEKAGDPLSNNVFFGGNLWGVIEKLDYLKGLGVTVLYLSPVFESVSNHRYDTADYEAVDRLLGGDAAFDKLIDEAHARSIRVVLDGVFNHTGDDSKYFNRRGHFSSVGAYQSQNSPYADWFSFEKFPEKYEAWWGIEIMPRLKQGNASCRRYFTGKDGIAAKWLRRGADGWRLDVADELPDVFLDELREVTKREKPDALLIGEVWENAVTKIAYDARRRYFRGGQLDSVMNYPFRNAVMSLILERDSTSFYNTLTELWGTYPPFVSCSLMNLLGTHDTERILSLLGDGGEGEGLENPALAVKRLTKEQRKTAIRRLKMASILQFTVFGVPSVYYGDEAGLEGYHDPFCRLPFPWGREEAELQKHYRALGKMRANHSVFESGDFAFLEHQGGRVAFERKNERERLLVYANADTSPWEITLSGSWRNALTGTQASGKINIPPETAVVFVKEV